MLEDYYRLTKPGIVYGNVIHTIAGSLFAIAIWDDSWSRLLLCALGVALFIASACVVNNYTDRQLDKNMTRTKNRPSVSGSVPFWHGVLFATILGLLGLLILSLFTSWLVVVLGVIAYLWYTVLYAYAKRVSPLGTLVGTVPGALPIVAGYVAVAERLDLIGVVLGLIIVVWQMAHFYAIAVFRKKEYTKAGVPVITTRDSFAKVRLKIISWILLYLVSIVLLYFIEVRLLVPSALLMLGGVYWLYISLKKADTPDKWARRVFGTSLILSIVLVLAGLVAIVTS